MNKIILIIHKEGRKEGRQLAKHKRFYVTQAKFSQTILDVHVIEICKQKVTIFYFFYKIRPTKFDMMLHGNQLVTASITYLQLLLA